MIFRVQGTRFGRPFTSLVEAPSIEAASKRVIRMPGVMRASIRNPEQWYWQWSPRQLREVMRAVKQGIDYYAEKQDAQSAAEGYRELQRLAEAYKARKLGGMEKRRAEFAQHLIATGRLTNNPWIVSASGQLSAHRTRWGATRAVEGAIDAGLGAATVLRLPWGEWVRSGPLKRGPGRPRKEEGQAPAPTGNPMRRMTDCGKMLSHAAYYEHYKTCAVCRQADKDRWEAIRRDVREAKEKKGRNPQAGSFIANPNQAGVGARHNSLLPVSKTVLATGRGLVVVNPKGLKGSFRVTKEGLVPIEPEYRGPKSLGGALQQRMAAAIQARGQRAREGKSVQQQLYGMAQKGAVEAAVEQMKRLVRAGDIEQAEAIRQQLIQEYGPKPGVLRRIVTGRGLW